MKPRRLLVLLICAAVLAACRHETPSPARPERVDLAEHARTIEALRAPKRERPLIAILADNAGTETTDFIVPYGVLVASGRADVVTVAPDASPIQLMPALRVLPQSTIEAFDDRHPDGADYVIVPAMHHTDRPALLDWIRAQSTGGATIVAICSGALVVAEAGLLDGRAATTHWFDLDDLERDHPTIRRVDDRRYVVDRGVVTTTGVSASVPISLALIEAIAGRQHAADVADRLGADPDWSATHDSAAFRLDLPTAALAAGNWLAFWGKEEIGMPVRPGIDEIALAFAADAWSRTYRSRAYSVAVTDATDPIETKRGLALLPDRAASANDIDLRITPDGAPVAALETALTEIERRYGRGTAAFVALQLEYDGTQPDEPRD